MRERTTKGTRGERPLLRIGSSTLAVLLAALAASTARGDGVGLVTVSKSLPEATIAVIDPESGTSSGTGSTDVRIAIGDIILFRFRQMPVPQSQLGGINGWITEYVPPNLQVVGARLIDANGVTVTPHPPGLAQDGVGSRSNSWSGVPCSGATCPVTAGGIAQLYGDVGVFYSTDPRTARNPSGAFITLRNGIEIPVPESLRTDSNLRSALGISSPYYVHNAWDWAQFSIFGGNTGNTPHLYGSPVAGPQTHYRHEVTSVSGVLRFNSQVGPWNRIRYPGSYIGTGGLGSTGQTRTIADASAMGHDLTPNNPLPTSANALRVAVGEVRAGEPVFLEVAFRVTGTPLDPGFLPSGRDANCGESVGGDVSGALPAHRGDDNMWSYYVPSPSCVYLNLLFDVTVDQILRTNAAAFDDMAFSIRARNLSRNPRTNVWVRQKYNSSRISLSDDVGLPPFPDLAPTCQISNCDGDGFNCIYWNLGTLDPSEEVAIRTNLEVNNGGDPVTPVRADFTSDDLGTRVGNPCAGGSLTAGFTTQEAVQIRSLGVLRADMASTTASASAGGAATLAGTMRVEGTQNLRVDDFWVALPAGWTVRDTGGTSTPDIVIEGLRYECSALCTTNTPRFNGVNRSMPIGGSQAYTFQVNVPAGASAGNYPLGLQLWSSQSGYGQNQETFFHELAYVSVGRVRSERPTLDCPLLTSISAIPGSTTEADGTVIRVYFNGIQRGSGTSSGSRFAVGGWHGPTGTFGSLYGGLEIRATAQAPGENESPRSVPCVVSQVSACQDGIDNDGDGLIDFPADPGCSSPSDGSEENPECSDGIDNDGDGDIDWPADLECYGPDDNDEGGAPACSDGDDNDGDGLIDYPADPGCSSPSDRSEIEHRRCSNGIDDDMDGLVDFPDDPGCHSPNDDDETDFGYVSNDVRARLLVVFDTSGSMNWHTCADDFTGGDGSASCPGAPVSCSTCPRGTCSNEIADDSRLAQARVGLRNAIAGYGEVEYGLMRFRQRPRAFACPTSNASMGSGGWQGAGAAPCSGGFSGGDLLVGFSPENEYDLLEWMDGQTNYPGTPPPGLDYELRGTGTTPIAGSLEDARSYLQAVRTEDLAASCRPYRVILITDGQETCGGNPVTAASELAAAGFSTYVIGFATDALDVRANLDAIAVAGGTTRAIFADDATMLSSAISGIVNDSILIETCNGIDDDCDGMVDEGFQLFCNRPAGVVAPSLCGDPGETVCDGVDDNCDGRVDEGLRNACGTCGAPPVEVCNGIDDDCDGIIDEGGVCDVCVVEPEICDGLDNDCDGAVDESLQRGCGTDTGVCSSGLETCVLGTWGSCTGTGPTPELCDNLDNDCDGVVDSFPRPCGSSVGACRPGTELCVAGAFTGVCVGSIEPSMELCDGIDNDCNGSVDDGNPGGGGTCGSAIGACRTGTVTCVGGGLTCLGATGPTPETCNGADDDCDGRVDEEIPTGGACGACGGGVLTCEGGSFVCRGDRSPTAEICNGIDDDCNGSVDEGNPGAGTVCGVETGACERGLTQCVEGRIVCQGAVGPIEEVCNDVDDDCDGLIDEGNPGGGTSCGTTDEGECNLGVEVCRAGSFVCVGATGPSTERCDGLDNDCDGIIDEGDPATGGECGIDRGECRSGTLSCVEGLLTCVGGVGPTEELCNGLDDDCNGVVDDGLDVGAPCGTSQGECVPGRLACVEGAVLCACPPTYVRATRMVGDVLEELCVPDPPGALVEVCNALDDDCDGRIDEELALGDTCGDAEGACRPGMDQCIEGRLVCVGEVPAGPEACDCEDNDCDGAIDEDPDSLCPSGTRCIDCACALPCADSEFGRCPAGRLAVEGPEGCFCVAPRCNPATCAGETVTVDDVVRCAPDSPDVGACSCRANACTYQCDGVTCADPTVCDPRDGRCVEDNCRGLGCPAGQLCDVVALECVEDLCEEAACSAAQACRAGECETSCAAVRCDDGEVCRSGACVADRCASVRCELGEACDPASGSCVEDQCVGVRCPPGAVCDPVDGGCEPDPCTFLRCPGSEFCFRGECRAPDGPPDGGLRPDGGQADGGTFDAGDPEERVLAAGGCACRAAGGSGSSPWGLGALVAMALALVTWRRRAR